MRKVAGLVLAALLACAAADASFDRLFFRSCKSAVEVFANGPFGGAFFPGFVDDIVDGAVEAIRKRAECKCAGQFTDDDFDLMFDPVTALLNNMQDSPVSLPSTHCLKVHFKRNLQDLLVGRVILPNTCTYNTWKTEGKCLVQLPIPALEATVKVALGRCKTLQNKASVIPFFSVNCVGKGCTAATTPCGAADACAAGTSCFAPLDFFNVSVANLPHTLFEGLTAIHLYADTETSPGCYQSPFVEDVSERTPANDIATRLLTVYNTMVTGSTDFMRSPKFCLPNEAIDMIRNATEGAPVTMPPQFTSGAANFSDYTLPQTSCITNSTNAMQVELTYLTSWDGQLPSGSVLAQAPLISAPTPAPTGNGAAYPLVRAGCDGSVVFGRELMWLKANNNFMQLLNEVMSLFKDMESCRMDPPMSKLTLIRHYLANNPAFWLPFLDKAYNAPLSSNEHLTDNTLHYLVKEFMQSVSLASLPQSCNMNTWLNTGKCTAMFTGLKRLLQLDVNPLVHVEECPSSNLLSYGVYCHGTDCEALLGGLRPCNPSASSCPSTFECVNLFDTIESFVNATGGSDGGDDDGNVPVIPSDSGSGGNTKIGIRSTGVVGDNSDSVAVPALGANPLELLKTHDMLEVVLGPNTVQDLCTFVDSENWNLTGITSEATCSGPVRFHNDLATLLVRIYGAPTAPKNPTTGAHFCMPTFDFIGDDEFVGDWARSLYSTVGSEFAINDLESAVFDPATGVVGGTDSPTSTPTATSNPDSGAANVAPAFFAGLVAATIAIVGQRRL